VLKFNFNQNKKKFIKTDLQHIAIIMDGNGRYASKKSLPTKFGHKKGIDNVKKIVNSCLDLNIKFLTIYAFSSENWNRSKEEIDFLMNSLYNYLSKESKELIEKNIKIIISGNLLKVNKKIIDKIHEVENLSKDNNKLTLNVAFSYGSRQEIVEASKKIAIDILNKKIMVDEIDEILFKTYLYQPNIPDPDLLIRTGGDQRLSNFLLWQNAYTELYFTPKFWPEFTKNDLIKAITNFNQRERRYGSRKS
jgi:undecaprenyl diphosphate synthase